jgi:hypothetical protein
MTVSAAGDELAVDLGHLRRLPSGERALTHRAYSFELLM